MQKETLVIVQHGVASDVDKHKVQVFDVASGYLLL